MLPWVCIRGKKRRNQATVIGALVPPITPTYSTRTALSTNGPCVMDHGLTSFEFKQVGVMGGLNPPIRVNWLRVNWSPFSLAVIYTPLPL
ncbi:hypothetical protein Y032_0053g2425 [Ancylostoma ceylanicum]|uniref:Uncharacterized protein n=1 Tax=Ancylostoma ceylanicum TaxID=53326 RepID=A0A016U7X4_9BILA|nr:hypothetical protein Y032_0053g2425 [Ancylostoma ceylanicum]